MYMILSPAKKLNQHRKLEIEALEPTQPHFLPKAEGLVKQLRQFSTSDLKKLMNVSEKGTKLSNSSGKNLYEYWSTSLSERINEFEHKEIVNLASKEYFSALHSKVLKAKIITPVFKEKRGDVLKIISFSAKKARGMMARFAVKNRIEHSEGLKSFTEGGYTYRAELSSDVEWLFVR